MALKYFFEYRDDVNHLHRCEISNTDFSGTATEIAGKCVIEYAEVSDPLEAIRGLGMRVELEADLTLTLEDLFTDEERSYKVIHTVEGQTLFTGFLKPDGVFQDFVNDKWVISLDCVDGLGLLENLSYVTSTGLPFSGTQQELQVISLCLQRTGLQQNINTAVNIHYAGLAPTVNPLVSVRLNSDRYVKDDGETIMQCDEVLRSLLEKYNACIVQQNGEWYIFRPNEIATNTSIEFFRYSYQGTVLTPATKTIDISKSLGSQIDNAYPHHINSNQRIEIEGSLGGFRVNYKYGLDESLLSNDQFSWTGSTLSGYTVIDGAKLSDPNPGEVGAAIAGYTTGSPTGVLRNNDLPVLINESLKVGVDFKFGTHVQGFLMQIGVFPTTGNPYHVTSDGSWVESIGTPYRSVGFYRSIEDKTELFYNFNITTQAIPIEGNLRITFLTPYYPVDTGDRNVILKRLSVTGTDAILKHGEFHTVQRTTKPSSIVKDVKEVFNGDNPSVLYYGTIYKNDGITPTSTWTRDGKGETKPILQIMAEETLRMNASPAKVFSGDIYGYLPYLSAITISGVTGLFMPLAYSYDTKSNIISLKLRQIYGSELTDIDYELTYDYGNVVKPTIIG